MQEKTANGEKEQNKEKKNDYGIIKIADDVIATIAGMAAMEVEGVKAMSGGVTDGISEILGKRNLTKGVKVIVDGRQVTVDLYLTVAFGVKIPVLAHDVQNKVKTSIETMTGLHVAEVNVHVQGVSFDVLNTAETDSSDGSQAAENSAN